MCHTQSVPPSVGRMRRQPYPLRGHAAGMGEVSYEDDGVRRFVVRRYAFDPLRHERRHIVVAVVDNEHEFDSLCDRLNYELRRRRASGEAVDPREHISGVVMEPGYLARSANGHLVRRAFARGVFPARLRSLELPGYMGVTEAHRQQ